MNVTKLKLEVRGWAKDDIVPGDLQKICKRSATKLGTLEAENKRLKAGLEIIDAIARNAAKLTSPLYPATIKMIREKVRQALKSGKDS